MDIKLESLQSIQNKQRNVPQEVAKPPKSNMLMTSWGEWREFPHDLVYRKNIPVDITPEGKLVFGYNSKGIPVCFAPRKNANNKGMPKTDKCMSVGTSMNGRCMMHGGRSRAGDAHPARIAKHARNAKSLPKNLQRDMNNALHDEDNLSLNHEIALVDTLIEQQKKTLETGLGKDSWKALFTISDRLEAALESNSETSEELCRDLISTIRGGVKERETWKEMTGPGGSLETRRRLVETASNREMKLKTLLKGDEVMVLISSISSVCKENIAKTLIKIEDSYFLTDKQTGKSVNRLDSEIKIEFLEKVGMSLAKTVGKQRTAMPETYFLPSDDLD